MSAIVVVYSLWFTAVLQRGLTNGCQKHPILFSDRHVGDMTTELIALIQKICLESRVDVHRMSRPGRVFRAA